MTQFSGDAVAVTGGGSGIGRQTGLEFANRGVDVVVADVDREGGEETVELIENESDAEATFVEVDVTESDQVEEMVSTAVEEYGSLDYAVNNAGIGGQQELTADLPEENWQRVIDINLTGVWQCLRHEIRQMNEQDDGGAIVNMASILGKVGFETASAYTAAKHGVLGLTKTAALEYGTEGVRINAVCPGFVETPMLEEAGMLSDETIREEIERRHGLERLGTPAEIADAVLWLCSDDATFTSGEALAIDGGYLAR
ncbi:SDR family oxidoreductase [Halobacteria archaeon AArc-m2/3/4]|uniref:SDR family oxidoreductase n=1 Tax=Natronoglomus mannanivorans TaxID=2979990 RepID=A0ABT2QEU1_9EURY|nr:SDR family oxidoreductase [Halobacteria archaeon AArc-m2/3/4]